MYKMSIVFPSLLALAACTTDEETEKPTASPSDSDPVVDPTPGDTGMAVSMASVRVVHAGPDAPAVDVWAAGGDAPLIEDLAWGEATGFLEIPAGDYTIELRVAGASGDDPAAYSQALSVAEDGTYTVIASGLLGATSDDGAFRLVGLAEGWGTAGNDESLIRIVHASPTAPSVSIDVGNDATPEIEDLGRFADTGVAGVAIPADTELQVGVWAGDPLGRVTAFTTPALSAGGETIIIATGLLENLARQEAGFQLWALTEDSTLVPILQNPVVYALHSGPDAPAVDIFAGDAELVDNLDFGEISAPIQVPPGSYGLDFYGHTEGAEVPDGGAAATAVTPELAAGQAYMAIATGFLGKEPGFQLVPVAEGFDVFTNDARLRVVHASPDAPPVDVGTFDGTSVTALKPYADLAFGESSDAIGVALAQATYDLGIAVAGSTEPVFTFSGVPITDGSRMMAVASGSVEDETFQLTVVDMTMSPWVTVGLTPDQYQR